MMNIKYRKEDKKACQREMKCYDTSLRVLVKLKDLSDRISAEEKERVIIKEHKEKKKQGKEGRRKEWKKDVLSAEDAVM